MKVTYSVLKLSTLLAFFSVTAAFATAEEKKAPEKFQVKFETSKGDIVLECVREWSPIGVDHFHKAVTAGFYDECRFFRMAKGFVFQFGINGDPKVQAEWRKDVIKDDEVTQKNLKGTLTYATAGKDTRTTQLFINMGDNTFLDRQGFSPFAKIVKGMDVVAKLNTEYGESPNQGYLQKFGNKYLNERFPNLDYIKKATVIVDKK